MKKNLYSFISIAFVVFTMLSCNNKERKVNSEGVDSDKIKVTCAVMDNYKMLMPGCKNMMTVAVEGIEIADALVYVDKEMGDAYMTEEGIGIVPYEANKPINLIVSFEEKGGTKEFKVADKLPEPKLRFFNAETNEILDFEIENITAVIVELAGDDKFVELFPEDSKYRFLSYEAKLMRGEQEIKKIGVEKDYNDGQINVSTLQETAKSGDKILIKIGIAERQNFEGNWVAQELPDAKKEITLTIK